MEFFNSAEVRQMILPGCISRQLVSGFNCEASTITLTDVTVEPGAVQPRHSHEKALQIWYALEGEGYLLLANDEERPFKAGDVAVAFPGDVHGFINRSDKVFHYITVCNPPQDFQKLYDSVR